MARKSTVKTLPAQIRAEVDRLLGDGRFTLDDVVTHLRKLGADVSRSALGRYSKEFEEVAARMRESREVATAFARELGEIPNNDMGRILVEMLHGLVFRVLKQRTKEDQDAPVKPMDLMLLAKAIKESVGSTKISAELEMKIRDRVAAETAQKAAGVAEDVAREKGLSAETVEAIKARILGIRKPARAEA